MSTYERRQQEQGRQSTRDSSTFWADVWEDSTDRSSGAITSYGPAVIRYLAHQLGYAARVEQIEYDIAESLLDSEDPDISLDLSLEILLELGHLTVIDKAGGVVALSPPMRDFIDNKPSAIANVNFPRPNEGAGGVEVG